MESCTNEFAISGSDSAPHPVTSKQRGVDGKSPIAAGVFTQPFATQYIILALEKAIERGLLTEEDVTQEVLENFLGGFGRQFYKLGDSAKTAGIILERKGARIPNIIKNQDDSIEVALLRGGDNVFSLRWASTWYT